MKKPALVLAVALAVVVLLTMVLIVPYLRLAYLEESLHNATDAEAAASIARTILNSNSTRGKTAIQKYADHHETSAFDATHAILLLCDENTGEIHKVYGGPQGNAVSTGDTDLDEAVTAAMPQVTSTSLTIGKPPKLFNGIHVLSADEEQVDFILNPRTGTEWYRVSFSFDRGRLLSVGTHDVTMAELSSFREKEDWPESWK